MYANGGIGGTRPTCHKTHAWAASQFAVSLGHERGPTLLTAGDESQTITVTVQAVEHGQVTLARNTKGMGDALGQEAFDKEVASDS